MSDLIDRQTAIDALARMAREKFNLSDEFNHYLAGLMDGESAIRQLPSAQPEIVRCKDCFTHGACRFEQWLGLDGYCSKAERRTDERTDER